MSEQTNKAKPKPTPTPTTPATPTVTKTGTTGSAPGQEVNLTTPTEAGAEVGKRMGEQHQP